MCEIFPELEKCCMCCTIRVSLLFIAICSIMTGTLLLNGIEKRNKASFKSLKVVKDIAKEGEDLNKIKIGENAGEMVKTKARKTMPILVPTIVAGMSGVFMVAGVILLFSNLTDQEGLTQLFVWMIFVNVLVGLVLVFVVGLECFFMPKTCTLRKIDWITSASLMAGFVLFLLGWIYFIAVANSYVLQS